MLNHNRIQAIQSRFDEGWSIAALARHYGHALLTVRCALTPKQRKFLKKRYKTRTVPAITSKQIMALRAAGVTMVDIASSHKISRTRVYAILKEAGVVLPAYHRVHRNRGESLPAS